MIHIKTRDIGIILILISVVLTFVLVSLAGRVNEINEASCDCAPGTCPMSGGLPFQFYIGITVTLSLAIIGIFLILKRRQIEKEDKENEKKLRKKVGLLKEDEKKIYGMVFDSDGVIFQSDLVKDSGVSKSKVSRILNKLENKGLVERKRRGLGNIVLLKRD